MGASIPRGAFWGFVVALPAGCYCCTLPYGGGIVAGPLVAIAGPIVGVFVALHWGAAVGLVRAGRWWLVPVVPAFAAVIVLVAYHLYTDAAAREAAAPWPRVEPVHVAEAGAPTDPRAR